MRPQMPPPPSPAPLNDRYAPQRQSYVQPRILTPSVYLPRRANEPGSIPPVHAPAGYPRSLPPAMHHAHLLPMPSGYTGRGGPPPSNYGVAASASSRPLVITVPPSLPAASQTPRQLRHYPGAVAPPSRTASSTGPNLGPLSPTRHHGSNNPTTVYRSAAVSITATGTGAASRAQETSTSSSRPIAPVPFTEKGSTSMTSPTTATAPTSKPPRYAVGGTLSEEELNAPALVLLPAAPQIDKELEVMTQGLKLQQQEWVDRQELKKAFAEFAHVMELLQYLRSTAGINVSEQKSTLASLHDLLTNKIPQTLVRLQKRTSISIESLEINEKDAITYSDEITLRSKTNERLRSVDLTIAERDLRRAKRRRRYQEEYEKLAGEILTKKPRTACQKELEMELQKLEESKKELQKWKRVAELRKLQTEHVLTYVHDLLSSLKNPSGLLDLLNDIPKDDEKEQNYESNDIMESVGDEELTLASIKTINLSATALPITS